MHSPNLWQKKAAHWTPGLPAAGQVGSSSSGSRRDPAEQTNKPKTSMVDHMSGAKEPAAKQAAASSASRQGIIDELRGIPKGSSASGPQVGLDGQPAGQAQPKTRGPYRKKGQITPDQTTLGVNPEDDTLAVVVPKTQPGVPKPQPGVPPKKKKK